MENSWIHILVILCFCGWVDSDSASVNKLYSDLLAGYDKNIAPGKLGPEYINVSISLRLANIIDINPESLELDAVVWLNQIYTDPRLRWSPKLYDNVTRVSFPWQQLWVPNLYVFNSLNGMLYLGDCRAIVSSSGLVTRVPVVRTRTRCGRDKVSGQVVCSLRIGSPVYSGDVLDIWPNKSGVKSSVLVEHKDWRMVSSLSKGVVLYLLCCPESYPSVRFNITFTQTSACPAT